MKRLGSYIQWASLIVVLLLNGANATAAKWLNRSVDKSFYSSALFGNVQTLTQDFPDLAYLKQRYKRVDYDYDLISGKVNMLSYNRSNADQYYQRYSYDADNRITQVQASADGYNWEQDAAYTYYEHGPLARIDEGALHVQGIDYAYTIQGWLKVMNADTLNNTMDMGKDGRVTINALDAVGYSIDYFKNDYKPITAWTAQHVAADSLSLYNGNISRQTLAMNQYGPTGTVNTFQRLNKQYMYDQLNRIMLANYATVSPAGTLSNITDYHNKYSYDGDGNIQTLLRYGNKISGTAQLMDSLTYHYGTDVKVFFNELLAESISVHPDDLFEDYVHNQKNTTR